MTMILDRVRGCLLGGAVGDALGAPVEFLSWPRIRQRFGDGGIAEFSPAYGRLGAITDDTQMTLFTAEGLLRAAGSGGLGDRELVRRSLHLSYLRWLLTQGERPQGMAKSAVRQDGWLFGLRALHDQRAPGSTCCSALRAATEIGTPAIAENDSKGCGGVMRAAPVGLLAPLLGDDAAVFRTALDSAALTHGHPSGFLSAGHLAVTIACLLRGASLEDALDAADRELARHDQAAETQAAIAAARSLAARGRPTPEAIEASLGGGWTGEEALGIAVCCALAAQDFADGVRLGANHTGDTDSTAAIAGNILGALHGEAAIPATWLDPLELRAEIATVADDLHAAATHTLSHEASGRYPG